MNRIWGNRHLIVLFAAVTMFLVAWGGEDHVGVALAQAGYEMTGELTGTLDGESFVRYTVGSNREGNYVNTATWGPMPVSLPGFPAYVVNIQGHKTVSGFDFDQAITLEFYLDDEFKLIKSSISEESVSYFPDGLTFDMERTYTMTEGNVDVTEVIKDGDNLEVKGSFAGILMRWQWTDQATFEGELVDPIEIEGQFHVHRVTYEE